MITIQFSNEVHNYVKYLVNHEEATDFESLDSIFQDELISIVLATNDAEIILSLDATKHLSKFLSTYDKDEHFMFMKHARLSAIETYSCDLDELIEQYANERSSDIKREAGLHPINDRINGEITWQRA